jgi:hypothetical protein
MGIDPKNSGRVKDLPRGPQHLPRFAGAVIGVLFIAAMVSGCGRQEALVGKYEAVSQTAAGRIILTLDLQADGKGLWSVETDNAPLRWDLHKNKIRLHTQTGGVIQGTMDRGGLQITMPGQGVIDFTKVP